MSTLGQLIDRAYREFLAPANEQPVTFTLGAQFLSSDVAFTVDTHFLSPEEEALFGKGTVVEFDRELVQVGGYDPALTSNQATSVKRQILGTAAATHASGTFGIISPEYPRQAIFDALCDQIVGLWPTLYAVAETAALTFSDTTHTEVPATVMEPMYVWGRPQGGTAWVEIDDITWYDNFPPSTTGKAISVDLGNSGTGYLVHKQKFTRPTAETDDLVATILLQQEWEQVALVGAVAHLVAGKDLSQGQQDFLVEQLKATNYPVLTPTRIRESLLKYHEYLMERAQKSLRSRQQSTVFRAQVI